MEYIEDKKSEVLAEKFTQIQTKQDETDINITTTTTTKRFIKQKTGGKEQHTIILCVKYF